jgi:hypothetical protein
LISEADSSVEAARLTSQLTAAGIVLAACGGAPAGSGGASDSATFALPPNAAPNWILPIGIPGHLAGYNSAVYSLLWPALNVYSGNDGSIAFDFERMNELEFYDATRPTAEQGFSRILVTEPDHPYMAAWWPPGHLIGYEHSFTHEVRDLIEAIGTGQDPTPSFADALQVQLVLDAVSRSAETSRWTEVEPVLSPV